MPKSTPSTTSIKPSHRYINIKCSDCKCVYYKRLPSLRTCPVQSTHKVARVWGSKTPNMKFVDPNSMHFRRRRRRIKPSLKYMMSKNTSTRLDQFLRDEGFRNLHLDSVETEDYDYAAPANFNPNMRYTSSTGSPRGIRSKSQLQAASDSSYTKSTGIVAIGPTVGRPHSPGYIMGKQVAARAKSAQRWAGRGAKYTLNRYKSLEWCHLQADSLGGPTTVDNLVAASFAANTEMLVIEHHLKGKTHLSIEVTAHCSARHVGELIIYKVLDRHARVLLERWIDARNDYFKKSDALALAQLLKGIK